MGASRATKAKVGIPVQEARVVQSYKDETRRVDVLPKPSADEVQMVQDAKTQDGLSSLQPVSDTSQRPTMYYRGEFKNKKSKKETLENPGKNQKKSCVITKSHAVGPCSPCFRDRREASTAYSSSGLAQDKGPVSSFSKRATGVVGGSKLSQSQDPVNGSSNLATRVVGDSNRAQSQDPVIGSSNLAK